MPDAAAQVLQAPLGVVGRGVEDDADALVSHRGGRAGIGVDHAQGGLDGGGLPRAVGPDEARHVSGGDGEGDVVEAEVRVVLGQVGDLDGVHCLSLDVAEVVMMV